MTVPAVFQHVVWPVAGKLEVGPQPQPLVLKAQPAVQASVPPPLKPRLVQLAPPRSAPSHTSTPSRTPFPQPGTADATHPLVLNVHPELQASVPDAKPSLWQVAPPRLVPSQSSPASTVPSPQKAVPLNAGVHSRSALNPTRGRVSVRTRLPNWSVTCWAAGPGVRHLIL